MFMAPETVPVTCRRCPCRSSTTGIGCREAGERDRTPRGRALQNVAAIGAARQRLSGETEDRAVVRTLPVMGDGRGDEAGNSEPKPPKNSGRPAMSAPFT
jgi:hypothetical protein